MSGDGNASCSRSRWALVREATSQLAISGVLLGCAVTWMSCTTRTPEHQAVHRTSAVDGVSEPAATEATDDGGSDRGRQPEPRAENQHFCLGTPTEWPPDPNVARCDRDLPLADVLIARRRAGTLTTRELCHALRSESSFSGSAECEEREALGHDLRVFVVNQEGIEAYSLVMRVGQRWRLLRRLETTFSGTGNTSSWLDAYAVSAFTADRFVLMWRSAMVDWDVGVNNVTLAGSCSSIECGRGQGGWGCSEPATMRDHGGIYSVARQPPGPGNWPYRIGAPLETWDCRREDLPSATPP